jgi:hypothetical protein
VAERLKSLVPKPNAALRIESLKRAIAVEPFPNDPTLWSAEVTGQPAWGSSCGLSEADARRALEIYIEDCKGDMEVLLSC